jgi:hypothetical protein
MLKQLQYECTSDYLKHRENIFSLHKRNYDRLPDKRYDSQYIGNPYGEPFLGLCYDGETLIGQENYIFQQAAYRAEILKCAMGVDTIVDPKYRVFYGVFKKLVELTMAELKDQTDFLYAFANEESKKYYLKYFNWEIAERVGVYKKVISPSGLSKESLLAFVRPGKAYKDFNLVRIEQFESEPLNQIIRNHLKKADYSYFYKTPEYLQWRFLDNTFFKCEGYVIQDKETIRGYVIILKDKGELKVIDFLIAGDDPDIFLKTIMSLAHMGSKQGLKRLVMYATPGCWYLSTLKKLIFIKRWTIDFIAAPLNEKSLPHNWVINMGDFDVL